MLIRNDWSSCFYIIYRLIESLSLINPTDVLRIESIVRG